MARKPASRDSPTTVPSIVERDYSLARMATVRTGGEAEYFARAGSNAQLRELLAWARAANVPVAVVGSGSNLLIADEGVRGLVVKLDRKLALIQREGPLRIVCGGGARLPAVATRAAQAGLSGIEFGVNIPGTVGGAVRMNANAYGGELARTLEWVEIVTARGVRAPSPRAARVRLSPLQPHGRGDRRARLLPARRIRRGQRQGHARGDARPPP